MNDINTKKLFDEYPEFFKNRDNMQASLMCFGFEHGDGWMDLIYNLCKDIKEFYKGKIPDSFYVVQVKEKYGSLRFYTTGAHEEVYDMIAKAENDSFYICEHCGKRCPKKQKGKPYKGFYRDKLPWILTLCDDCLRVHLRSKGLPFDDYISGWQKSKKAPFVMGKG